MSCHHHHFSKANDNGRGEPLYYSLAQVESQWSREKPRLSAQASY